MFSDSSVLSRHVTKTGHTSVIFVHTAVDINISQGSVATHLRYSEICHLFRRILNNGAEVTNKGMWPSVLTLLRESV